MSVSFPKKDSLFDSDCVNAFLHIFTKESFMRLSDGSFETNLWEIIPRKKLVFDWEMCKNVADFFAKIVDYKSSFTSRHSIGVAEKAAFFAQYIGYDSINVQKIYLAGALHDIGKMAVGNEILENRISLRMMNFQNEESCWLYIPYIIRG